MTAKYIVRFDDLCATMNWSVWERIERILSKNNIQPLLAVVPDNRDPKLMIEATRSDFWDRVRGWQAAGWSIGLHGFEHRYQTRCSGLVGINAYSEFAGLPYAEQHAKLKRALTIFERYGVRADAWVAPAHAFDMSTVNALKDLGVDVISDGFFARAVKRLGALWVPQQIWQFRPMPFGLWTVCYHHNHFSELEIRRFESDVESFASQIVSLDDVIRHHSIEECALVDVAFARTWLATLQIRRRLKRRV